MVYKILKADLNDEYYPIEQILGGQAKELDNMYNAGLNKIINICMNKEYGLSE